MYCSINSLYRLTFFLLIIFFFSMVTLAFADESDDFTCTDGQSPQDVLCVQLGGETSEGQIACFDRYGVEHTRVATPNIVGMSRDPEGNLYHTDTVGQILRKTARDSLETTTYVDRSLFFPNGAFTDMTVNSSGGDYVASSSEENIGYFEFGTTTPFWSYVLNSPDNLVLDSEDNLYLTAFDEQGNPIIQKIDTSGVLTTLIDATAVNTANLGETLVISDMMKQDIDGLLVSGTQGEIFSVQFATDKQPSQIIKKYAGTNLPVPVSGVAGKYDTLYVSVEAEGKIYQYPSHGTDVTSLGSVLVEGLNSPTEMNWTHFCPGENLGTTEDPGDNSETGEETSNTTNQCLAEGGEVVDLEYLKTYLDISTLMRLQEGEEIIFEDENGNEATASYLEDEVSFKAICVSLEKPADIVMVGEGCTLSKNSAPQDSSLWILMMWIGIRLISFRSWRMRRE